MDVRPTAPVLEQVVRRSPMSLRKRGPRSFLARQRRFGKFVQLRNSLHGVYSTSLVSPTSSIVSPGTVTNVRVDEARSTSVSEVKLDFSSSFSVLHVNIRGWRSHVDELAAYLDVLPQKPSFIAVNETFLNKSVTVDFPGYFVAGRRDRFCAETNAYVENLQCWGGILLLAAREFSGSVVQVLSSDTAERLWFILHCNVGPVLLCIWYRPPCPGDITSISTFNDELQCLRHDAIGTVVIGDLNCHNKRWLRFSANVSTEGRCLYETCVTNGFTQKVLAPTRGDYLLDVCLSDLDEVTARVLLPIADHHCVLAECTFQVDVFSPSCRSVWNFRSADWPAICEHVALLDFSFVESESVDVAALRLTAILLSVCDSFVAKRTVVEKSSSHPWLNERCRVAVLEKQDAFGTDSYAAKCISCSAVLREEYGAYVLSVKRRLAHLRSGSKQFWSLSKKLLLRDSSSCTIPALKDDAGSWIRLPRDKANLFARTFRAKWTLPAAVENFYSFQQLPDARRSFEFVQIRSRTARFFLNSLDLASSTGPDGLSTVLLRNLASVLCFPFARLARRIVQTGKWPSSWKVHWICPLHKRKSRASAANYRGLQLTSQLSKAMERLLGIHFLPQLSFSGSYGTNQFAYRRYHGARDAILFVLLSWLLALAMGKKIGVYCSDVSGAFDRVDAAMLLLKLGRSIIPRCIVRVIADWLVGRRGEVIVQGCSSDSFPLSNMTYQGTVWGPPLWNLFFADAPLAVRKCGFQEIIYADDLNAFRCFLNSVSNEFVLSQLRRCQFELHEWGAANSVTFDAEKESFHVISRSDSHGNPFKLLGVQFDLQLTMNEACSECAVEGHWRLSSLLRSRRFFALKDLALHYKSHILSYIEYRTPAITHAANVHLNLVDSVQKRFLRNINLTSFVALHQINLAPLSCRRDIANLGIIFRAVTKRGPLQLRSLFRLSSSSLRSSPRRPSHRYQVIDTTRVLGRDYLDRSTFGYVAVFNILPECVFHFEDDAVFPISVSSFQSNLTSLLKSASNHELEWEGLFSPRTTIFDHVLRRFSQVSSLSAI